VATISVKCGRRRPTPEILEMDFIFGHPISRYLGVLLPPTMRSQYPSGT
jgi:hypothetical protein